MKIMANLKKVIKLTQGQYDTLAAGGTVGEYTGLNDDYIYLTPDNKIYATEDYVDSEIDDLASRISNSYVRYDINSQGLTDTQKSNARTNIGAGTYSKSSTGIPAGDLDAATRATLVKASNLTVSATNGVSDGTNTYKYTHPSYSAQTVGLYKIGRDSTGHVTIGDAFTIPTVNNATLTIQKNGTTVNTFTANASSNVTANITVPTKLNDLSERYTNLLVEPASYGNTPTITTMARIDKLRANRFAGGLHPTSIICEISTDAGATWSSAELSDNQKLWLVTNAGSNLYIPLKNGVKSCSCMARVTISGIEFNDTVKALSETARFTQMIPANWYNNRVYATVSDLYFWLNANSDRIAINVYASRGNAPDTWENAGSHPAAAGWSGMNTIHLNKDYSFGGGDTQTGNYWFIRITFRTCASDGSFDDSKLSTTATTSRQSIMNIMGYGANCWGSLHPMGNIDRPYTYAGNNGTYGHEIFRWNGDLTPTSTNNFAFGTTSMQWAIICGRELYENGTKLENKYLGKTAKAADADKLDGNDSTYYLNYSNLTNKPSIPDDSNLVHKNNNEDIAGTKRFLSIELGTQGTGSIVKSGSIEWATSQLKFISSSGYNVKFYGLSGTSQLNFLGTDGSAGKINVSWLGVKDGSTHTFNSYLQWPGDKGTSSNPETLACLSDIPNNSNLENGTGTNSLQQKGTTAGYDSQTTLGTYNNNKSDTLLEVGNGSSGSPSNALEVYADGHVEVGAESALGADIFIITVTSQGTYPVDHASYGVTDLPVSKFEALYNYINNNGSKTVSESSSYSSTIISVSWTATTRTFDGVTYNAINCNAGGPGYYLYKYSDTEVRMSSAAVSLMTALTVYKAGTDSGVMNILSPNTTMGVVTVGQFVNTLDSRGYTTASEVNNYRYKHTVRVYLADKIQLRCEYIISKTQSSDYASVAPNSQVYLARALYYAGATSQSIAVPATGMVYVNANTTGIVTGIYSTGTVGSNIYICYLPIVTSSGSNATIAVNVPSESTVQLTSLGSPTTYGYAKAV